VHQPEEVRVAGLRRYPVKSMGGESLDTVDLDARGLAGDRGYAVVDDEGRLASGKDTRRFRRRDAVFAYAAATDGHHVTVTRGAASWRADDPALAAELTDAMGAAVRLEREGPVPHQDGGAVSLVGTATLAWCARRWGIDADPRRLRVNVLLETDEPFVEESWVGGTLTLGGARLTAVERIPRCRMVDVEQDAATARGAWLRPLAAERDLCLGVYADVAAPGRVAVGDAVVAGPPARD